MGLFSRRPVRLVPDELLDQLSAFGRTVWECRANVRAITDPRYDWDTFFSKLLPAYQTDFTLAIAEIHAAAGDDPFARIGGYRLIAEFDGAINDPLYLDMMDTLLEMMSDHGLGTFSMTGYEADRWAKIRGDSRR